MFFYFFHMYKINETENFIQNGNAIIQFYLRKKKIYNDAQLDLRKLTSRKCGW